MFRNLKLATTIGASLLLASGIAQATAVPAGTLTIVDLGHPAVDNTAGTINLGNPAFITNGTGLFNNASTGATFTPSTFSFNKTIGAFTDYSASPLTAFFSFAFGGDNYTFDLDQNIQTTGYSFDGSNGTVALYILGDITATGSTPYSTLTPAAFTLTLNETGGSGYSASATFANPPPGSGITTVPEPASMTLLGGSLAALGFIRRRRLKS